MRIYRNLLNKQEEGLFNTEEEARLGALSTIDKALKINSIMQVTVTKIPSKREGGIFGFQITY